MKTCPECAEQIQDAASVCRYCGHRFFRGRHVRPGFVVLAVLAGIVAIYLVISAQTDEALDSAAEQSAAGLELACDHPAVGDRPECR